VIIVDTSIWIDHLHRSEAGLARLLDAGMVAVHPMVVGELAMGSLRDRDEILSLLTALPKATQASHDEVLDLVTRQRLHSRGLSYVDGHLLASALLTPGGALWTRDRRLREASADLQVAYSP